MKHVRIASLIVIDFLWRDSRSNFYPNLCLSCRVVFSREAVIMRVFVYGRVSRKKLSMWSMSIGMMCMRMIRHSTCREYMVVVVVVVMDIVVAYR